MSGEDVGPFRCHLVDKSVIRCSMLFKRRLGAVELIRPTDARQCNFDFQYLSVGRSQSRLDEIDMFPRAIDIIDGSIKALSKCTAKPLGGPGKK